MLNIGSRPTVNGKEKRMEVNIFNFNKDIYHERLQIQFVERLRAEQKFDSKEALADQLARDKQQAQKILNTN
jgi:riboflavin kinase/FMN adenylyltransferase